MLLWIEIQSTLAHSRLSLRVSHLIQSFILCPNPSLRTFQSFCFALKHLALYQLEGEKVHSNKLALSISFRDIFFTI